jgi:hypothetical protein
MSLADPPSHLGSLIRCTRALIDEEPQLRSITPLTVFIPSKTTMINADSTKQLPSPTNSSTRSTVVRSQSSSESSPTDSENSADDKELSQKEGLSREHLSVENGTPDECLLK